MNFRIYASGLLLILVYQLAIAAVVIWSVGRCETAGGTVGPGRGAATANLGDIR